MKKVKKRGRLSCINGAKGAISLFLAVLMTPFLTIALLLVEVGRYNSAVSVLDEALGVSSLSTLANYDDYLQERWGLMALSQEIDYDAVYKENLEINGEIMGNAINIDSSKVEGMYALSDPEILKNQIIEYSKLNVPTKLATEFVNLSDLVKKLENLAGMGNIMSLLTKGVDAIDSGITLIESAEKLKESASKLDGFHDDYEAKYSAFETATNTLISNLQKKKDLESKLATLNSELDDLKAELKELQGENEEETTEPTEEESEKVKAKKKEISDKEKEISEVQSQINSLNGTITSNRSSAKTAQTEYADILSQISSGLSNFKESMADCNEAVISIQNDIAGAGAAIIAISTDLANKRADLKAIKEDLKRMEKEGYTESDPSYAAGLDYKIALEKEVSELETQKALYDATSKGLEEMTDSWNTSFEAYSDATLGETIKGFDQLRQKVLNLDISSVSASTPKITRETYKSISLGGYINADDIEKYLLQQEEELKSGSLSALLDGLTAIYNELMGLSIFFEDNLDACIDLQYYNDNFGGLPGGAKADGGILEVIKNIGDVCGSASGFVKNLVNLKLLKALKELKKLVKSVIALIESIAQVALNLLKNIANLLTGYDKWYYGAYAAYNLSCRTDYSTTSGSVSLKTMSGYSVGKDSFPEANNNINVPIFGELAALIGTINTYITDTGKDITFSGAELEYILFGSTSEIANQLYVFCVLYLIRLLFNIPSITSNVEVQGLAASATLGYPVVIGLYIVLEPLVQTILLVNGSNQALVPATVYLSPSGLPKLVGELVSFCKLTDEQAEKIGNKMVTAISKSQDDYDYQKKLAEYQSEGSTSKALFDLSYREYCFILLLLTVDEPQLLARLSNLIQMETHFYYQNQKKEFNFDLKKSYSYLYVQVNASMSQVMPSLADSSLFTIERDHYRGY